MFESLWEPRALCNDVDLRLERYPAVSRDRIKRTPTSPTFSSLSLSLCLLLPSPSHSNSPSIMSNPAERLAAVARHLTEGPGGGVKTIVVFGAGLMGAGIVQIVAQAGYRVHMVDVNDKAIV